VRYLKNSVPNQYSAYNQDDQDDFDHYSATLSNVTQEDVMIALPSQPIHFSKNCWLLTPERRPWRMIAPAVINSTTISNKLANNDLKSYDNTPSYLIVRS
jgi:hypothetical protein